MEGTKTAIKWWHRGNQKVSPWPRGEEGGSFRNLTWLGTPYFLAGGHSTVGCEEMNWGWDRPGQHCTFSPQRRMFNLRSSWFPQAQVAAGRWDPCGDSSSTKGAEPLTHPRGMSHGKFQWMKPLPGLAGLGVLNCTAGWSTVRVQAVFVSHHFHTFTGSGARHTEP